ncbi:hypothetical protein A9Z40_02975 [Microbacterium arborescens]|uniref:Uncharacterized protein n=1 Tax=Microbacterium arborescens TaxID=33883 RepID=A0ABX2WIJ3_9MICO|nr:hypothetical protein [Microbacterium arborescens]OAZ40919.1 hypothetical protein A9Z40_02975 [Microbacterium arborescens]
MPTNTPDTFPTFEAALAAFQAELPEVPAERELTVEGAGGELRTQLYADLADIHAIALPALGRFGLFFSAMPTTKSPGLSQPVQYGLAYELTHTSGTGRSGFVPLPDPVATSADDTRLHLQAARRSALLGLTGIAPRGVEPVRRDKPATPESAAPTTETPRRDYAAEAAALTGNREAVATLWQTAREEGAPVDVLDAIAKHIEKPEPPISERLAPRKPAKRSQAAAQSATTEGSDQ